MHHPGVAAKQNSGMSAVTLGKVPGSGLGIPDILAATLGNVLGSGLGILDGVAATLFSGVLAMA